MSKRVTIADVAADLTEAQRIPAEGHRACHPRRLVPPCLNHEMLGDDVCTDTSRRFRLFAEKCGTDAWLDVKPLYTIADEDLPPWSTEI